MRKHAKATLAKHKLLEAILWETFFDMVRVRGENEAVKSSSATERADSLLVSWIAPAVFAGHCRSVPQSA
jgi:hypothetical protein